MIRWKTRIAASAVVAVASPTALYMHSASGAVSGASPLKNPATGVGSCTLKNPHPKLNLPNPTKLPLSKRHQTYRPDNYDCNGAPLDSRLSEA